MRLAQTRRCPEIDLDDGSVGAGGSRADFWDLATSRARGTCGAESGTVPRRSPTTSSRRTRSSPPITASAASSTSARPTRGRPRMAASDSASRVPAIRWSGDAAPPRSRTRRAASTKNRATPSLPGWSNTWRYHPGLSTPAEYPEPTDSRRCVHGTHATAVFTLGRPRRVAVSVATFGASGPSTASAGTCHAPQTTTISVCPARRAARIARRM